MALILFGRTECPLCSKPIQEGDEYEAFAHFIDNDKDPFWKYSDAVFHRPCFEKWNQRDIFLKRYKIFEDKMRR